MLRFLASALIALPLTWFTATSAMAGDVLKLAALAGWPPYSDAELPGQGFSNDLVVQAMKRAGYTVEVTVMPWARALELTQAGDYDILPSAWYSKERDALLKFSEPIATNRIVFVHNAGEPFEFHSLNDLKGKVVGVQSAATYGPEFMASDLFKREPVTEPLLSLKKVAAGRIDLTLDDELVTKYTINTKIPELASQLALTKGALSENGLYVTFSRKRPDVEKLAADFNKALADMKADGTYDKLLAAHKMN
jgi:polar amino acid transport system substrate-binding protein